MGCPAGCEVARVGVPGRLDGRSPLRRRSVHATLAAPCVARGRAPRRRASLAGTGPGLQRCMIFTETELPGAFVIDIERREDDRGYFARAFCQHEFDEHGLKPVIAQANVAFNHKKGTLRGMHFQFPPAAETKVVRCTRGAILDIIVDLRPESPTYLQHIAVELNEDNHRALYVPERFAHGYQVLVDKTETSYQVGEFYTPGCEGGLLYSDPQLGLEWPLPVSVISDKDQAWPLLAAQESDVKARMSLPVAV